MAEQSWNLGQASLDLLALADRPLNCYTFDQDLIGQASRFRKALAALPAA
jgi:hypothetical protein